MNQEEEDSEVGKITRFMEKKIEVQLARCKTSAISMPRLNHTCIVTVEGRYNMLVDVYRLHVVYT